MTDQEKPVKAHCNSCGHETWHNVLAKKVRDDSEVDESSGQLLYSVYIHDEMLECCGCENVTLRHSIYTEDAPEPWVTYFPPAISRRKPDWLTYPMFASEHSDLCSLMEEIYAALYANSFRLAMMGARTAIEMVMSDKLGEEGGFDKRLGKLAEKGLISTEEERILHTALEAGHAAVHRRHKPAFKEMNDVMAIVEHLLHGMYVLGKSAEDLRKVTPPRNKEKP